MQKKETFSYNAFMNYLLLKHVTLLTYASTSNSLGAAADLAISGGAAKGTEAAFFTNQPISFGSIIEQLKSSNASKINISILNCLHGEWWTTNAQLLDVPGTPCQKHASIKMHPSIDQMRVAGAKGQTTICQWLR